MHVPHEVLRTVEVPVPIEQIVEKVVERVEQERVPRHLFQQQANLNAFGITLQQQKQQLLTAEV